MLDELALESQRTAVREMNERHASLAVAGLKRVLQRIVGDDQEGVQAIDPSRLTAQDCAPPRKPSRGASKKPRKNGGDRWASWP
jgi:hypothetical protein